MATHQSMHPGLTYVKRACGCVCMSVLIVFVCLFLPVCVCLFLPVCAAAVCLSVCCFFKLQQGMMCWTCKHFTAHSTPKIMTHDKSSHTSTQYIYALAFSTIASAHNLKCCQASACKVQTGRLECPPANAHEIETHKPVCIMVPSTAVVPPCRKYSRSCWRTPALVHGRRMLMGYRAATSLQECA